jgi:hypothetical protein
MSNEPANARSFAYQGRLTATTRRQSRRSGQALADDAA